MSAFDPKRTFAMTCKMEQDSKNGNLSAQPVKRGRKRPSPPCPTIPNGSVIGLSIVAPWPKCARSKVDAALLEETGEEFDEEARKRAVSRPSLECRASPPAWCPSTLHT
jgi:hypothetical protein